MKTFFVAILFFGLGVGAFYGYNEYTKLKLENEQLKHQISPTPTPETMETTPPSGTEIPVQTETTAAPGKDIKTGTATGTLGYPSEHIPSLTVYAINTKNKTKFYFTETSDNEAKFTIDEIAPGEYYFVAYLKSNPESAGGYTNAVACGLLFSCKDHSLIPVNIEAGKKITHVEIKDWYAEQGTFPKKPN